MEKKRIMFIVNPKAGRGKGLIYKKKVEDMLKELEAETLIAVTSEGGANSPISLAKRAVQEGFDTIVSIGGDGTHSLLIDGMMAAAKEQGIPLESLPKLGLVGTGTGNNFAKNLGIHFGFKKAMELLKDDHVRLVDLGLLSVGGENKYFINVLSFGFDGLVVADLKGAKKKKKYKLMPRSLAYLLIAVWRILPGLPSYKLFLSGPDFNLEKEVALMAVLNGPTYGAVFRMAPTAELSDGLFDFCLIEKVGRIKAMMLLPRVVFGKHTNLPQFSSFRASYLKISSPQPLPCEIDGEVLPSEREYEILILRRALKILSPRL